LRDVCLHEKADRTVAGRLFSHLFRLFQERNCTACHQFYGLGGYMGPDLTNVISTTGKGPLYARVFIQFGTAKMPNFHLTGAEVDAMIAFLEYVDASGKYPAQDHKITWLGTVELQNE
jgi:nitric oxide reductase subunit C